MSTMKYVARDEPSICIIIYQYYKSGQTRGCQSRPNVNIPDTEKTKLIWTHQEKRIRRNENIKDRLKVESIAEGCRKARLRWFCHVKRRDHDNVGRNTLEMVPSKARKTEAEMDGLCQPRHESHRKDEVHDRTGWRRMRTPTIHGFFH